MAGFSCRLGVMSLEEDIFFVKNKKVISGFYTTVDKPLYGQTSTAVQVKQYRELGQSGYRCRCKDESSEGEQSRIKDYG